MVADLATPPNRARPGQRLAYCVSTLTLAAVGCVAITAAAPFLKSAALQRQLATLPQVTPSGSAAADQVARLHHLRALAEPYRDRAVHVAVQLAATHAARQQYDPAVAVAADLHATISTPATTPPLRDLALQKIPEAWGRHFYHHMTAARQPTDPWIAYRELAQRYRAADNSEGWHHLMAHLDDRYERHPWRTAGGDTPAGSPSAARARQPATTRSGIAGGGQPTAPVAAAGQPVASPARQPSAAPASAAPGTADPHWGIAIPGGAMAYNARRDPLRDVPAGTLIDVIGQTQWENEPMVIANVFHFNRWVTNIYLRTAQVHIVPGVAQTVNDRQRDLHLRRLQLLNHIADEEQRIATAQPATPRLTSQPTRQPSRPTSRQAASAPVIEPAEAQRLLQELAQRAAALMREFENSEGPRRADIGEDLKRMRLEEFRLRQAAAGVTESLGAAPVAAPQPAAARPTESPRLRQLRRELAEIEAQLNQLAAAP